MTSSPQRRTMVLGAVNVTLVLSGCGGLAEADVTRGQLDAGDFGQM